MKPNAAFLLVLVVGMLPSHRNSRVMREPLIEFTYADEPWAPDSAPVVQQCGYYALIRGTISHSGGFRPGASVRVLGDTLAAVVDLYAASAFDQRDATRARWTLRIGALDPRAYQMTVAVGGKVLVRQGLRLTFRQEGCAA